MKIPDNLLQSLEHLSAPQLRRLLTERLTQQKLGLYWESSAIERDAALNATRAALDAMAALPCRQLRVYSTRPAKVREHFQTLGREVESLSLQTALLHGQIAPRRKRQSKTQNEPQAL